jgi:adenine phosphoribosyltransferase
MKSLSEELRAHIRIIQDFPQPGISFKDISPVFLNPDLVRRCVRALAESFQGKGITRIVGIESRGFLLGVPLSLELNAGFVMVRKRGKLPYKTVEISYDLEYGSATIEMHEDALRADDVVLIHDDLLATGGTAMAAAQLVQKFGCKVFGFAFLVELTELGGKQRLNAVSSEVVSLVSY